jgi:VIT1/CCC1 family predicted Fe2+/Mn2+ transporter
MVMVPVSTSQMMPKSRLWLQIGAMTAAPSEWLEHLQDEADAAFLYRRLAASESNGDKATIYGHLAEVEDRHVGVWLRVLKEAGHDVSAPPPSRRARLMATVAGWFGPRFLLPALLAEEGREVKSYLDLHRRSAGGPAGTAALDLARESKEHAEELSGLVGRQGEPWHRAAAGGFVRNVVYGFNDGLTANFGLVAGMIGAQGSLDTAGHAVVVAGLAGAVADALSMGSSGYLAAKSEREVFEHEIAMEREEIRLMPELEREELALIYQAKGIPEAEASRMATAVMADPERALGEKAREELGISEATSTPVREGTVTGLATLVGAMIPVAPLLVSTEAGAIWTSFALAMLSHFVVGAARSMFTGRSLFRSGFDMFVVGLGVAALGYFIGEWLVKLL